MSFPNTGAISASSIRSELYNISNDADGTAVGSNPISWSQLYGEGQYIKDYGTGKNSSLPTDSANQPLSASALRGFTAVYSKVAAGGNTQLDSVSLHPVTERGNYITRTVITGTYNEGATTGSATTYPHVVHVNTANAQLDGEDQTGTGPTDNPGAVGGAAFIANNPVVLNNNAINTNNIRGGGGQGGAGAVWANYVEDTTGFNSAYNGASVAGAGGSGVNYVASDQPTTAVFTYNNGGTSAPKATTITKNASNVSARCDNVGPFSSVDPSRVGIAQSGPKGWGYDNGTAGSARGAINPSYNTVPGSVTNPTQGTSGTAGSPGQAGSAGNAGSAGSVTNNPKVNAGANYLNGNPGNPSQIKNNNNIGSSSSNDDTNLRGYVNMTMNGQFSNPNSTYNYSGTISAIFRLTGGGSGSSNPGSPVINGSWNGGGVINNAQPGGAAGSKYSGNVTLSDF